MNGGKGSKGSAPAASQIKQSISLIIKEMRVWLALPAAGSGEPSAARQAQQIQFNFSFSRQSEKKSEWIWLVLFLLSLMCCCLPFSSLFLTAIGPTKEKKEKDKLIHECLLVMGRRPSNAPPFHSKEFHSFPFQLACFWIVFIKERRVWFY